MEWKAMESGGKQVRIDELGIALEFSFAIDIIQVRGKSER